MGLIILLLIPAGYLIITSSIDIVKALKEKEETETSGTSNNAPSSLDNIKGADRERLKKELLEEMMNKKKEKKDE
jgi:hypothetical protein